MKKPGEASEGFCLCYLSTECLVPVGSSSIPGCFREAEWVPRPAPCPHTVSASAPMVTVVPLKELLLQPRGWSPTSKDSSDSPGEAFIRPSNSEATTQKLFAV